MDVGHEPCARLACCCCGESLGSLVGDGGGRDGQASGIEQGRTKHHAGRGLRGDREEGGCSGLLSGEDLVAAQAVTRADQHDRVSGDCTVVANLAARAR